MTFLTICFLVYAQIGIYLICRSCCPKRRASLVRRYLHSSAKLRNRMSLKKYIIIMTWKSSMKIYQGLRVKCRSINRTGMNLKRALTKWWMDLRATANLTLLMVKHWKTLWLKIWSWTIVISKSINYFSNKCWRAKIIPKTNLTPQPEVTGQLQNQETKTSTRTTRMGTASKTLASIGILS